LYICFAGGFVGFNKSMLDKKIAFFPKNNFTWHGFCYTIGMELVKNSVSGISGELKTEIVRKSIHFLVAFVPAIAAVSRPFAIVFLVAGTLAYIYIENLRLLGIRVPVVSSLIGMAARSRDRGRFVLGPVTLGLGAVFTLLFFPPPFAAIAIYALAFGDGFASIVGKFLGRLRPAFLYGKSIEGSLACFFAVLISAYWVSLDFRLALIAAACATSVEALPLGDYDNLALPVSVGLLVTLAAF